MPKKKCEKIVDPKQFSCGSHQTDGSLRSTGYESMKLVII